MKSLFASLLLTSITFAARAQATNEAYAALPKDSTTHAVVYSSVIAIKSASKDELFARAQSWAAHTFTDSKAASRVEDKAAGTLLYHSALDTQGPAISYAFTATIRVKDGRYKYEINDISRTWGVLNGGVWVAGPMTKPLEYFGTVKLNKAQQADLLAFDGRIKNLLAELQAAMGKGEKQW